MFPRRIRSVAVVWLAVLGVSSSARAVDPLADARWPGWRGPNGQGVALEAKVPLEWSETKNIVWKTELPGRGHSSPIVWGDRIFVTTAIEGELVPGSPRMKHPLPDGTDFRHPDAMGDDHRHAFKVMALDARDGKIAWERTAWEGVPVDSRHKRASFASPTAVTDGERVYAYFGTEGLFAYDFTGNLAWKFAPGVVGSASVGLGTSPVLYKDLVILLCDEENGEKSFIVGLDRRTGKEVWRTARTIELSWATPVLVSAKGRDELVTAGNTANIAYDPATGRELWRTKGLENNAVGTPLVGDGVVVIYSGYPDKISMAVKPGGTGDVTGSILWRYTKGSAYVPSRNPLPGPRLSRHRQGPGDLPRREDGRRPLRRPASSRARQPHGLAGRGGRAAALHEPGRRHLRGDRGAEVRGGTHEPAGRAHQRLRRGGGRTALHPRREAPLRHRHPQRVLTPLRGDRWLSAFRSSRGRRAAGPVARR